MTPELARAGGVIGVLGLAVLIAAPSRYLRLAGLAACLVGGVLLAAYLALTGHRPLLAAAGVFALAAAALAVWLVRRWPWLLALGVLACAPVRIPVHLGGTDANLLVPLYFVVTVAALQLGWALLCGDDRARELGPVAWPLAALTAWTGLTFLWAADVREGALELAFFYLPFGLLAIALARLPWSPRWLRALFVELVLMGLVFAGVGVYQYWTRDVFWNPKVIVGNAYAPFYRVNSVFWDPSIYGRFLVVVILASLVLVVRGAAWRLALAVTAVIVAVWIGLLFSFSQSSFVALIVGVIVLSAFAWRWKVVAGVGLVTAVLLAAGFAAPPVRRALLHDSGKGLNSATSDRSGLMRNGAQIALHNPIGGVGVGSFKRAYADRLGLRGTDPKKAASHDTPVTVAAETGIVGLGLFLWLLAAACSAAFKRVPHTFTGRASLAFGIVLIAIVVHSLFYNAFFEDPMSWALLGLCGLGWRTLAEEGTA